MLGRRKPPFPGDRRLAFAGGAITYRDLTANMLVTGITGGGKSSAMAVLLSELMRDGCGLYLPGGKPGDARRYADLARRAGRTDVYLFDQSCRLRVNFLDAVLGRADDATLAVQAEAAFSQVAQALSATEGRKEGEAFWVSNTKRWTRMGVRLMLAATEKPSIPLLLELVTSSAANRTALAGDAYGRGACCRLMRAAYDRMWGTPRQGEYEEIERFWHGEVPDTADRTRSGFVAGILGPADVLAAGIPKAVLCSHSTVSLADLVAANAVVITDFSYGEFGPICPVVNTALKYGLQRTLLRRTVADDTRPFVLAVDEYQTQCSDFDAEYLSLCRSARGPMVLMSQGYDSLRACMDEHRVAVLTGNCAVRLFMSPTPPTAEWLIKDLLGQRLRMMLSGSTSGGYESPWDIVTGGRQHATGGFQQSYAPWLTQGELFSLRTGGRENDRWVDFVLTIAGRTWDGAPFTVRSVRQEG